MYKEYIVLTKTGAALSSWQSHSKPHKPLKEKGGRAIPSASRGTLPNSRHPFNFRGAHLPKSPISVWNRFRVVWDSCFSYPPKIDDKRNFLPTTNHQTHEQ